MLLPIEVLVRHAEKLSELAKEMNELAELRRALCLHMTERSRPSASRPLRHTAGSLKGPSSFPALCLSRTEVTRLTGPFPA